MDPSGHNLKKLKGAPHDGTRQNHNAMQGAVSKSLARAKIIHMGGRYGNPRTCKGIFRGMAHRLAQLIANGNPIEKVLQLIIPDILINGLSLQGNSLLAGVKTLCDFKTLSAGGAYTENRSDKPNAVVNARQKQASEKYNRRADELDSKLGITEDEYGFRARLKEFGPYNDRGRVNIPVIGSYGEMSNNVYGDDSRRACERALRLLQGQINQGGHGLLPQPALPDLGAHSPPRMGAPSPRPPVPGTDPQRPQTPHGALPRQRRLRRADRFRQLHEPRSRLPQRPGFPGALSSSLCLCPALYSV